MEIKYIPINKLIPYDKNPRKNDKAADAVAASIKEFGFKNPIVLTKDMVVINGHTRLKAAKKLGMKEVPCIIADDLTDEQAKAFRLADNKVGEIADWDFDLLGSEMDDLPEFDFEGFGFDLDKVESSITHEYGSWEKPFGATNFYEYDEERVEGRFEMPMLEPCDFVPDHMIGFKYCNQSKDYGATIHFYLDDYQFERLWNRPRDYINLISKFNGTLTPNFSIYYDMPEAIKIWNTYRSRLLGQMYQDYGFKVIPIVYWSDERSFDYCFDGLPENATLSINNISVSGKKNEWSKGLWDEGVKELIHRKHPKRILLYGNGAKPNFDFGDIEVIQYKNDVTERMTGAKKR